MTTDLNFVEGEGIAIQLSPNPGRPDDVTDIEISCTVQAAGFDPATATSWWFPLVDSDGVCVLDSDGDLIPTLIPL